MKKCFFTGLALLLPIVLTVLVILLLLNILTRPFEGAMVELFNWLGLLEFPLMRQFLAVSSKVVVLIALLAIITFVGLLGRVLLVKYLLKVGDRILHRIPLVNKVYKAAQDVVNTLFVSEKPNFSQVVLVPFPHEDALSIGLITNHPEADSDLISVFLPATPNPTMGFMGLYKESQIHYLDIKVEDALRAIVSCGSMLEKFSLREKDAPQG